VSQPLEFRFTDPAAPLFIDLEGDNVECLFVISTSQVHGITSSTQRTSSQAVNTRKRERSESETPKIKKSMKVVQPANPETYDNHSRQTSRVPGSMPPPSMPPPSAVANRSTFHAAASHGSHQAGAQVTRPHEPLFLPASQLSAVDEAVIRSTGLGIENMNSVELAEMLEAEGEEVDFSYMSQPAMPNVSQDMAYNDDDAMQVDEPDSLELVDDSELDATQSSRAEKVCCAHRVWIIYSCGLQTFQPLFED
jgi:cell cycle checkpoint control protein RAD9A